MCVDMFVNRAQLMQLSSVIISYLFSLKQFVHVRAKITKEYDIIRHLQAAIPPLVAPGTETIRTLSGSGLRHYRMLRDCQILTLSF